MADLDITPSEVKFGTGAESEFEQHDSGEVIDAGELIYLDRADANRAKLADASAQASSVVRGMAVCSVTAADQKLVIERVGLPTIGANASPIVATQYWLSETAGKITDTAPTASGAFVVPVGQGAADDKFKLGIENSQLAVV